MYNIKAVDPTGIVGFMGKDLVYSKSPVQAGFKTKGGAKRAIRLVMKNGVVRDALIPVII